MDDLGIIYSPKYLNYSFGLEHPFWPERAEEFIRISGNQGLSFQIVEPKPAEDSDVLLVHTKDFLERVKKMARQGGSLSIDTPVNKKNLEAAYYYVGGTILASDLALKGEKVINL